jgi:hypothetical protein
LDGAGAAAQFKFPEGLCLLDDTALVLDFSAHRIRSVDLRGIPPTDIQHGELGGRRLPGYADGPPASCPLFASPRAAPVQCSGTRCGASNATRITNGEGGAHYLL